jgi:hypothetical protein
MVAMTLIGVGMGMVTTCFQARDLNHGEVLLLWFGGGGLIGTGAYAPLKKPLRGLAIGLAIQAVILLFLS